MSFNALSEKRWRKAELHSHCSLDPVDYHICRHTAEELISRAARLGYEILAITCHDRDVWTEELADFAGGLGITLIPGMEVTTEGVHHTLVYNFKANARDLDSLRKIRNLSCEDTLVIAPHPFYPGRICLGELLEKHIDVFDAVECSGFHIRGGIDFNRRGEVLAAREKKPLVGTGDVHHLWQLDRTFTWIYSEPGIESVLNAVKQGMVRVQKSPLSWFEAAKWWANAYWRRAFPAHPAPEAFPPGNSIPAHPSDEIEHGRCFGTAQESVEP